ncbi:hypothetical protein [Prochlorococcus marinus]|uniref:Rod shape-determining protein MreD n=1 Tax=Prochlorococcus marinus XMU1408 TaxID=2213228 RepID=A0A318R6I9_PROMR|nr:hypothetical protein [Prochlorococcus marinus]MBW3042846.1 hypothetical protein [Prochlorococcus marinus str. XMU1408]PYE00672.1 hypothetical protein DNJ73_09015 [Prochlorococcus marinus XMU1408]
MIRNKKKILIFFTSICLPALIVISPDWLKINGISPCWPVIFLLPFSLENRPWRAVIASIFLGFYMDSFIISEVSYIPSLLILSLFWSQYGLRHKKIELFLGLGLMAIFGTALVDISIWIQKIILHSVLRNNWFHSWSIYVLISNAIITGLVAPFFSSWLLIAYKKN